MSGLSLQYPTNGIENGSLSTSFHSNNTFNLNCTSIDCLDRAPRVINSPWFIGLIIAIVVLIIVFAIVCGIMKRKGGKYSAGVDGKSTLYNSVYRIQDKEMLHGPSGYGDNDGKFSEYYRAPSDVSIKQSHISLHNGDDRDSMAEFNDEKDRSRFTEDGSFIGQYGRDDKRHTNLVKYDENDGFPNEYQNDDQGKYLSHL
ncbi:unnamed protein product [Rotaria sordida]|uniref:Neurofascin/L1/NrCAM C-terminal domain-containing protein n=1 Tax=Rotaria sordida TaxID=392033 RepID=A0A814GSM0_9BILA|nr:unnamed protein product [Rotaria sordida]